MALTSGTKLGPYEILAPAGAGGMGEVYRARDTRLDRIVAVKVLPSHLCASPDLKQRFEREAKAISSLNHQHICTLYDVGSQDGVDYLVMEYLEGQTLAERLTKGALPLDQVLKIGIEVAEALDKAHRQRITHRDLKPGNIMLTKAGAKLLDFGLAKPGPSLVSGAATPATPSTPTMSIASLAVEPSPITQKGSIVGTVQYIAPEVLQGAEADARSDIFSFGCVLYEMITGKCAFQGKSQLGVLTAILEKEPEPIAKLQPMTPAALGHVVHDCLAKDPETRWQSASDVARELRWTASSVPDSVTATQKPARRTRENLAWAALVAVLAASLLWLSVREHGQMPTLRSFLTPPANVGFDFTGDFSGPPTMSPDGSAVAYCARSQSERDFLWVQSLNDLTPRKLEGTAGASFPFWSADGKFIGFFGDGHLRKVPAAGRPVTVLADAPNPRGGSWNADNIIIYEPDYRDPLWRISAAGGTPIRLTSLDRHKHTTHRWPSFLPDGKHFLFFATNHSGGTEQGIYMGSLDDGSYKHVINADSDALFASGYLLYHLQSALLAQKFDPATGRVSGDPAPVANMVEYDEGTWHTTFTVSRNGLLIYEPGSKTLGTDLYWLDRTGKLLHKVTERGFFKGSGRLSPDGKRLAVSLGDPQADIWVFDLARGSRTRLTFGGATHLAPAWSADGQRVVYVRQGGATIVTGTSLCSRLANGGGQEEVLLDGSSSLAKTLLAPQWTPDGRYLVHMEESGPTDGGIWALPTTGDKKPIPIVQSQSPLARIVQFRLSPDGKWLAYSSTESGREEVYVTHFPSGSGRWQVSQTGGTFPVWRGDGKEIFFIGLDGSLHSATVSAKGDALELEQVRALFAVKYTAPLGVPFDVSPDGQRFIFATYPEGVSTPLVLVSNWTADLKK